MVFLTINISSSLLPKSVHQLAEQFSVWKANMSEEQAPAPEPTLQETHAKDAAAAKLEHAHEKKIFLVSYPKVMFLYPTFFATLICGFVMLCLDEPVPGKPHPVHEIVSLVFLGVFALNLVVITFDFPRTTSLTLFFFVAMICMGLFLLLKLNPEMIGFLTGFFEALKPVANAYFYFLMSGIMFTFYLAILVAVQFDYWEVRPNELLHHHGFLSDLKRYSAPNLRIDKEINDVFEYILLRSGRLIIHPSREPRAIVLENVCFINKKERMLTKMLGAVQVQVRGEGEGDQ